MSRSAVRFPVAESLFQDSSVQPYIHNCEVTVLDGQHVHRFRVFFKRHRHLPWNPSLSDCNHIFRGDVVVMRVGKGPLQAVVNMRARDSEVADYMISLFAQRISELGRGMRPPRALTFLKLQHRRVSARIQSRHCI
ncbi:hypothetical protein EV363DRAFT_1159366 [Boletus edulis]|nr:hypothetical protein EV363DRAFT_1159366 [Boletus edulis]